MNSNELMGILYLFNDKIKDALMKLSDKDLEDIQEIRLRNKRFISVTIKSSELIVTRNGKLSSFCNDGVIVNSMDIDHIFKCACQFSVHSFKKELSQGFITVKGGCRIGFCGTAVVINNSVETIKDISAVNIRVARQIRGCADDIYNRVYADGLKHSLLIIGAPSSGKTTVLRDLCRKIGQTSRICIIDERNEITATLSDAPQNDVGIFSDVLNLYPKAEGCMIALRVLSPQYIACDEIGGDDDVKALCRASNCGVRLIATVHAESIEQALNKESLHPLFSQDIFDYIALLDTGVNVGKIISIKNLRTKSMCLC